MSDLSQLLAQNRAWAARIERERPGFFAMLRNQQRPKYLWIGCADSRVPANEIVGLPPGEVFVHRNVANLVVHSDLNALSVIEFATTVLGVRDIIVCGHYGCGGVAAALQPAKGRLVDHWIRHIRDIAAANRDELRAIQDDAGRVRRLCELNVAAQVANVRDSPVLASLRDTGIETHVHGWIYDVGDGLLTDITAPARG
jgi:carbonic anhydrase